MGWRDPGEPEFPSTLEEVKSRCDRLVQALREAEQRGAELIVVGSLDRGRMARILMGSVADKLVRTASVPVLVVR